jgi:phosphatidylglycerophosphate synthase
MSRSSVPDVATLRAICHTGKVSNDSRFWYVLSRRFSIYITWLLLHTRVRPNQVTMATVALALLGVCLLAASAPWVALWGAIALLAHFFLDKVDGDIARFRKIYSVAGVYLDYLGHSIVYGGIFAGLGLHLARHAQGAGAIIGVLGTAAVGALAMEIGNQHKNAGFLLFARSVLTQPDLLPAQRRTHPLRVLSRQATQEARALHAQAPLSPAEWFIGRVRDGVLLVSDYSVMLPLVTAGLIVEVATGDLRVLTGVFLFEAFMQAAVLLSLVWINYSVNVEEECRRLEALIQRRDDTARPD